MRMNRRSFMKAGVAATVAGLSSQAFSLGSQAKPNIVLIVCDQMVIDGISAYRQHFGHKAYLTHWLKTPNLDRMVNNGTSFLRSYASNPVCSPDRAAILTGRPPVETGMVTNGFAISPNVPHMGQWFAQESNYTNVYCGKWHLPQGDFPYNVNGYQGFYGIPTSGVGVAKDPLISANVSTFLRNYTKPEPFLAIAAFLHPHDICYWHGAGVNNMKKNEFGLEAPELPPNLYSNFSSESWGNTNRKNHDEEIWRWLIYDYCRQIEMLDTELGKVLDAVDNRPDADNTIVIFTSDHGEAAGRFNSVGKGDAFQYAYQVPLIFYCPGRIMPGVIDDTHLVSAVDIMPTVCDFAGISVPPHMRGYSLRGIVEGNPPAVWRDFVYGEYDATSRMLCDGQYKYVFKYAKNGTNDIYPYILDSDGSKTRWIDGQEHLLRCNVGEGLFDVLNDPWEMTNLADLPQHASRVADMDAELRAYMNTLLGNDHG